MSILFNVMETESAQLLPRLINAHFCCLNVSIHSGFSEKGHKRAEHLVSAQEGLEHPKVAFVWGSVIGRKFLS